MEIIQATSSCSRLWLHHHHHHQSQVLLSVKLEAHPQRLCNSVFSATHKTSSSSRTNNIRAILDNSSTDSVAVEDDDRLLAVRKKASEISSDLRGTCIFLVGVKSSYKSSLGRVLADALRYYYFDSDSLVEEAVGGQTAAISLIHNDQEGYLASETEVLRQLSSMGRLVVSAGNGAVKTATNLALLRHGISILIDVPLDLVAMEIVEERVKLSASDTAQCRSSSEVLDQLAELYGSARSGYSNADATISLQKVASQSGYDELEAVTTEDLCMEVLNEIERLVRVKKMMEEAARPF